jgi:hypothetical protein
MIDPSSPYAEAAQALQRGCRDEAERVAHIVFLSVPRARRDLFSAPPVQLPERSAAGEPTGH